MTPTQCELNVPVRFLQDTLGSIPQPVLGDSNRVSSVLWPGGWPAQRGRLGPSPRTQCHLLPPCLLSPFSLLRMLKNSTPGLKDKVPPSGEEKAAATYHFARLSPLCHTTLRVWLIYSFPPPRQHCAEHTAPGHSPLHLLHCLLG